MRLLAYCLAPVANAIVRAYQRGFLASHQIESCLFDIEVASLAWGPAHERSALLPFDIERAFPSLHLDYPFAVLSAKNMPNWYMMRVLLMRISVSFSKLKVIMGLGFVFRRV